MMNLSKELIESNRKQIIALLKCTKRRNIEKVIGYLEESGFFRNPSSQDRHHNWVGGLAQHSLQTYQAAQSLHKDLSKESLIICGLLHDICKAREFYLGRDHRIHRHYLHVKGHGYRSIWLLKHLGLHLTEDERRAIRWHMKNCVPKDKDPKDRDLYIARQSLLWQTIHQADHLSAAMGSPS